MTDFIRKRLVIGNWKMHGTSVQNAALLSSLGDYAGSAELAVCVPFPYLAQASQSLEGSAISWGAQDVSAHAQGAYTGEVSAAMLADFTCRWVLVGHSERRAYHGETDALVADKTQAAIGAGLTPVVCIGETLAEREAGRLQEVMLRQLDQVLALGGDALSRIVLAYEPVWAIGTGQSATPELAQEAHAFIRAQLERAGQPQVRVLYGGSVNAANAASLFEMPDIDGALVGGASLQAQEFLRIAAS
ncbi:triose-phosphate isomerase [Paracandidimonas soli]|uniref:triose-phosphate isomerase n=1 Tax=Paracandidimonas soli TaxID=1917182 RepID=UPI00333FBE1A